MNSKKGGGILMLTALILVSILAVSLVSAGFWDIFKKGGGEDLEGELREEFKVAIEMENSPPTIVSWDEPVGYDPTSCTSTAVTITIYVSDPDGDDDLTTGTVTAQFSRGGVDRPGGPATCTAGTPNGDLVLEFTCIINMEYYDEAGDWEFTVTADDNSALSATNSPQLSDPLDLTNYPYFPYNSMLIMEYADSNDPTIPLNTIEWTSPTVTATTAGQAANTNLVIDNCGNVDFAYLGITGRNLISVTPATNSHEIYPASFSVDETSSPCGIGEVLNEPPSERTIAGTALTKGAGQTEDLYFCLEDINPTTGPDPINVDSYTSQDPPDNWELTANE